jgi:hypothetical protein
MASNIPKFASFRPKPKAVPESTVEASASASKTAGSRRSRKETPKDSHHSRVAEAQNLERESASSKPYYSDRRGDPDILRYGTLNRSDIPAYRRFGHGCVLGLSPSQKIDRELSSQTKVYMTPATRQRQERLLTGKHAPKEGSRTLRIIQLNDKQSSEYGEDFIAVSSTTRKKRDDNDDSDEETPGLDYLDIQRGSNPPVDPDTQYDSETEDFTAQSELTKRNSELIRRTRDAPQDIQAWLNFIEHQKAMIAPDRSTAELNAASRQQLADLRIPIYEEALKKFKNDPENHIKLYQGLLKEAQGSWNEGKLSDKWKEVLVLHPSSTKMWLMYLDFVQSNFAQFKYESCRATFIQCLQALQASPNDVNVEIVLHVLIRMTSIIHGSGYQELALAIWQAILECNFSQPTNAAMSQADMMDFEEFWESEAPRIGEPEANGWRKPVSSDVLPAPTPLRQPDPSHSVFEDFASRETESTEKLRYPGRASDEVGEDDAFHTIFFADIEEYLKFVPVGTPHTLLVEAFLCFCGLPPLPRVATHQRVWWNDSFLLHSCIRSVFSNSSEESDSNSFMEKLKRYSACDQKSVQMTSTLLFSHEFPLHGVRLSAEFVRRILQLFATGIPNDELLGEYLLAFESRHFPLEVVKTAKHLLKANPSSQRLYHAYGLVESRRSKYDKAIQVFSMALSMSRTGTYESLMLLSSWVWEALRSGDQVEALWRLTSPTGKLLARTNPMLPPDASILTSTLTNLSEICEKALLQQEYPSAVIATSLLALLDYLPSDHNADLAITAHQRLADYLTSHTLSTSPYAELNAQAVAHFLIYHLTHSAIVKPVLTRSAVEPLITLFPNNTLLLSLYAANEVRFAIDDRVRAIMHSSVLQSSTATSVAGWSFAIHFETLRGASGGSTAHSIRAMYKRATHPDSAGAHCPALWAAYLSFEMAQLWVEREKVGDRKPGRNGRKRSWEVRLEEAEERVKSVFYLGVRRVPWCKDFVMLGFTVAKGVFGKEEMSKIYGVMMEKEMRVYVEVE